MTLGTTEIGLAEAAERTLRRTIPFDYAFRYELTGRPDRVHNSTVAVSIEASFVAVSIGYGLIPKVTPLIFGPPPRRCIDFRGRPRGRGPNPRNEQGVTFFVLDHLNAAGSPEAATATEIVPQGPNGPNGLFTGLVLEIRLPFGTRSVELTLVTPPPPIIGIAAAAPTPSTDVLAFNQDGSRAGTARLTAPPDRPETLRIDGAAIDRVVVTSKHAGPLLLSFCYEAPLQSVTLADVLDSLERRLRDTSRVLKGETGPEAVLKNGFKLNPSVSEAALLGFGDGATSSLDPSILENLFQAVGAPADQIQFKYAIFDDGSGREFQSEPILNTAGLGISNGDRPFRYFARPIAFAPRSTIRMQVTEVSDFQGELHVSLQGYKILGSSGTPTGRRQRRIRRTARR